MEYKIENTENENGDKVFQVVDQDGNVKSTQSLRRDAVNDIKLLNSEGPDALMPKPETAPADDETTEVAPDNENAEPLNADGTVDEDTKAKRKK